MARRLCQDQHALEEVTSQPNTFNEPIARRGCPRSQRCDATASAPHQDSGTETFSQLSEQDEPKPDEHVMGQECPSDSNPQEALTKTAPTVSVVGLCHGGNLAQPS